MSDRKAPALTSYTARELKTMKLPPLQWVVADLIGIGLWLLAAPPKTGKSFMVLRLLLALATGGLAFGKIRVTRTPVLYLALEDNKRRLRSRLSMMDLGLGEDVWPETFYFINDAPTVEAGLAKAIEAWLDEHPDVRVVVIDTLARVRGARDRGDDMYTSDSRFMSHLQRIALERDICILLVHHTRKQPGEDQFETISGSHGITGPVDGMLVLQRVRGEADATLHITGRDVEDKKLALRFDSDDGSWTVLGDARHYALSSERRAIIEHLTATPGLTPKELADAAGLKHGSVKHLLIRMRDEALLRSDDRGRYYLVHSVHREVETPSSTKQSTVNDYRSPPFTHSPDPAPSGERVNSGEGSPFTVETPSSTGETPYGERGERDTEGGASPLLIRATAKAPDIMGANLEALRGRYQAAATTLGGSIPSWWAATARTEPQAVTLAVELVAEDLRAGAVSGQVHAYLAAARNALGGNQ